MIRIVTDTSSDITNQQAKELGVELMTIPISFDDGECTQGTDEDFDIFYSRLETCDNLPSTSQPSASEVLELMETVKDDGDDLIFLTISSGLSGTSSSAEAFKQMINYEGIYVIDSTTTVMALRILVEYAVKLRSEGKSAKEIFETIEAMKHKVRIYAAIDTLKYLQKGGRVPKSLALIGGALNLKPVIACRNTVLETLGKARGSKGANKMLVSELEKVGINKDFPVYFGYSVSEEPVHAFMDEIINTYQLEDHKIYPVGPVVGTHVGPNVIAVAFVLENENA